MHFKLKCKQRKANQTRKNRRTEHIHILWWIMTRKHSYFINLHAVFRLKLTVYPMHSCHTTTHMSSMSSTNRLHFTHRSLYSLRANPSATNATGIQAYALWFARYSESTACTADIAGTRDKMKNKRSHPVRIGILSFKCKTFAEALLVPDWLSLCSVRLCRYLCVACA